jgi:hypothetical protein
MLQGKKELGYSRIQVRKEVKAGYGLPAGEERRYIRVHIAEEERDYSRIQIAG